MELEKLIYDLECIYNPGPATIIAIIIKMIIISMIVNVALAIAPINGLK